jgi:hypothetical protein
LMSAEPQTAAHGHKGKQGWRAWYEDQFRR